MTAGLPAQTAPRWMGRVLRAAGIYNVVWGALVVLFPLQPFAWVGLQPPRYPELWQCIGMIVGVYGIGYWIAASDPRRHWPIVLVGLLGKVFGPLGFLLSATRGSLPWSAGWTIVANDLIWWVPFAGILWWVFRSSRVESSRKGDLKIWSAEGPPPPARLSPRS